MIVNPIVVGGGIELPTLSNPGAAADLRNGKQLIGQDGQAITGTMQNVTLATPTISVATTGTITAQVNQTSAGYMATGNKSSTLKLSSAHDAQFIPANIKNGVNIFGVTGTYQGQTTEVQVDYYEGSSNRSYSGSQLKFTLSKSCSQLLYIYSRCFLSGTNQNVIAIYPTDRSSSGSDYSWALMDDNDFRRLRFGDVVVSGKNVSIECTAQIKSVISDYGGLDLSEGEWRAVYIAA